MNIRDYWQGVRSVANTLPELVMVISIPNAERGTIEGKVSECHREAAARLIFGQTHRQATESEVQAHQTRQAETRKQIIEAEYKRKQQFALPEELSNLVKLALAGQQEPKKRG